MQRRLSINNFRSSFIIRSLIWNNYCREEMELRLLIGKREYSKMRPWQELSTQISKTTLPLQTTIIQELYTQISKTTLSLQTTIIQELCTQISKTTLSLQTTIIQELYTQISKTTLPLQTTIIQELYTQIIHSSVRRQYHCKLQYYRICTHR